MQCPRHHNSNHFVSVERQTGAYGGGIPPDRSSFVPCGGSGVAADGIGIANDSGPTGRVRLVERDSARRNWDSERPGAHGQGEACGAG